MGAAAILTVLKDGEKIRSQPVDREIVVGRSDQCVLRLDDRAVSREHLVLRPSAQGVEVQKKSKFGPLLVNGAECTSAIMKQGDVIAIGPYLMRLQEGEEGEAIAPVVEIGTTPAEDPVAPTMDLGALPELDEAPAPAPTTGQLDPQNNAPLADANEWLPDSPDSPDSPSSDELQVDALAIDGDLNADSPVEPFDQENALELSASPDPEGGAELEVALGDSAFGPELESVSEPAPMEAVLGDFQLETPEIEMADEGEATKVAAPGKIEVKLILPPGVSDIEEYDFTGEEVTIGRGKDCTIVLHTKKASRMHATIRRAGLNFVVKDLDSINGTYVNGERIQERELNGDDVIRVGGVDIRFRAMSSDYIAQEPHLSSPVPPSVDEEAPLEIQQLSETPVPDFQFPEQVDLAGVMPAESAFSGIQGAIPDSIPAFPGQMQGQIPGMGPAVGAGQNQSLISKYRNLPKRTRLMVLVAAFLFVYLYLPDEPTTKKPAKKTEQTQAEKAATVNPTFEALSGEQKRFVEAQYELALDHLKNRDYDKSIYEVRKIFELIPDFKDAKEIERYAQEGKRRLEAIEEEKRRKEEEAKLKAQIAQLEDEGADRMAQKQYAQAKEIFYQIVALDPENQKVEEWRKQIEEEEEARRLKEQEKRIQGEINKRAWEIHAEAVKLKEEGKWFEAIDEFKKVIDIGASDKKVVEEAKAGIEATRQEIADKRDPILADAKQLEESGDLAAAFRRYEEATQIDPGHAEGFNGMKRIRGVLHERARVAYAQAVLSESYSDFVTARQKFEEVLQVAPKDDIYYQRAKRKLGLYLRVLEDIQ